MDLPTFWKNLRNQLRADSSINNTSEEEAFLEYLSSVLIEAEELDEGIIYLPFEGIGSSRRKIQIDGYSYNEIDECLALYIVAPLTDDDNDDPSVMTMMAASNFINRAIAFIEEASIIVQTAEESAPAYELAVIINNHSWPIRKYCVCVLTDMYTSRNLRQLELSSVRSVPVEQRIIDITYLHQLAESKTGKEDIVINMLDYTNHGLPCLPSSQTADYTAYLCNIPGITLAQLYDTYGGRLLEGNVRSFLQVRGKVNKGIRNTILNEPDMFFAYNNGITATAYSIETEQTNEGLFITEISALQIVNGGQTTASLAYALFKDKRDNSEACLKKIYVPMKLSIVSPEKARELIPRISRYANSQNKISEADLWSNHPFHIRMEDLSRKQLAPPTDGKLYGTRWYYERANGQYRQETYKLTDAKRKQFELQNPKAQMFTKTDLAKVMNIKMCLPHIASTGGQKSFAKFAVWVSTEWEKNNARFNDKFFREVVAMIILFRQTDKLVRKQAWYIGYKANIIAYTLSKIIHSVKTCYPDRAIDYRNIWVKQGLTTAWVEQLEIVSKAMHDVLTDENRPVGNITEWAKREACWDQVKNKKVQLLPSFVKELIDKIKDKQESEDETDIRKETNKAADMIQIYKFGEANWKYLLDWNSTHDVLSPRDVNLVKVAVSMFRGKSLSDRQCKAVLDILKKARDEGFPK